MFDVTKLEVELLPGRTTMVSNALGGSGGDGTTGILGGNILSNIAVQVIPIASPVDQTAAAGVGGAGGDAASVVGG